MEENSRIEEIVQRGYEEGRSKDAARLGFFELEETGDERRRNADNVCVLVVHYEFKENKTLYREGDEEDVHNLRRTFQEKRNCTFRELLSPSKADLLDLLKDEDRLLRFFSSQEAVPDVFILFVLSHGAKGGIISTDHYKKGSEEYVNFTTVEIFECLRKLVNFTGCLKFVNFGPCRGPLDDSTHCSNSRRVSYDNRDSCRVTFSPDMHNLVVMYSTVETTMATRDKKQGSWLVRMTCESLNSLVEDKQLLVFLTGIQFKAHIESRTSVDIRGEPCGGQTPELKLFSLDASFVVSALSKGSQVDNDTSSDATGKREVVSTPLRPEHFYTWQSDAKVNIRSRRAIVFYNERREMVKMLDEAISKNLSFDTSLQKLTRQNLKNFFTEEFEGGVGCLLTCVFGEIVQQKDNEVCVCVDGDIVPVGEMIQNFIGPTNQQWIGKPKIFIIIEQQAQENRDCIQHYTLEAEKISATNHSGWLVLILMNGDLAWRLIDILNDERLTKETSLQELLCKLFIGKWRDSSILLNSTLQYLLDFPEWQRVFVRPIFAIAKDQGAPQWSRMPITYEQLLEIAIPALYKNRVWLISSEAGSGKTTVLKQIAFDLVRLLPDVKMLLLSSENLIACLSEYSNLEPENFIAKATHKSPEEVVGLLTKKKAVVFLDGFDEIPDIEKHKMLSLAKYLTKKNVPLWISTRPQDAELICNEILKDEEPTNDRKPHEKSQHVFEELPARPEQREIFWLQICPLNKEQQVELVKIVTKWSELECEQFVDKFEDKIILGNPFHLTLVVQCNDTKNLYDIYTQVLGKTVDKCLEKDGWVEGSAKFHYNKSRTWNLLESTASQILQRNDSAELEIERLTNIGIAIVMFGKIFFHMTFLEFLVTKKFIDGIGEPKGSLNLSEDIWKFPQCRKFIDSYFSWENNNKKKIEVLTEEILNIFQELRPIDHHTLLLQICSDDLSSILSALKPNISFEQNEEKRIYAAFGGELVCRLVGHGHMAMQLLEIGAIKNEHQLANILPKLLRAIALSNATEFFIRLREKFPNLQELIRVRNHKIDAASAAIEKGHHEILEMLLSNGLDVNNSLNNGQLASMTACKRGDINCMQVLLRHGAKLEVEHPFTDGILVHAFFEAVRNGHIEFLQQYLVHEELIDVASKDYLGMNAMHIAISTNKFEVVKFLHNVDRTLVNGKTEVGESPLHLAVRAERWELCLWLIREGQVSINILNSKLKEPAKNVNFGEVAHDFNLMLSGGTDTRRGQNALHCAARYGCLDVINQLLESGLDASEKDNLGWNALHHACRGASPNLAIIQVDNMQNANINGSERYLTAVKKLHDKNASLTNERTADGSTALHLAVLRNGNMEMLRWLTDHLSIDNINARDSSGRTAMQLMIENQSWESACLLLNKFGTTPIDCIDIKSKLNEQGDTILHFAARVSKNLVETFIKLGAKSRVMNCSGEYPVLHACFFRNLEAAEYLHTKDNDLILKGNHFGLTAIHLLANAHGDLEMLRWLVERAGININSTDCHGNSALLSSLQANNWNAVDYLLTRNGIDVHQKNIFGMNALHFAVQLGRMKTVKILLDLGADPRTKDEMNGFNAIHFACASNNLRIMMLLHSYCSGLANETTNEGQNALQLLLSKANCANEIDIFESIEWLLDNIVDLNVNHVDKNRDTSLLIASRRNIWSAVDVLLRRRVNIVSNTDKMGMTALHYAALDGNVEMIEKLLSEYGADLNAKDKYGRNALHCACFKSELDAAKFLHGKDKRLAKQKTKNSNTALHLAALDSGQRDLAIVRWLVEEARLNPKTSNRHGQSALLTACSSQRLDIVFYLHFFAGVDVTAIDKKGKTALHYFAKRGRSKDIPSFIKMGCDFNAKCKSGYNILHEACTSRNYELIKFLGCTQLIREKTKNGETVLHLATASRKLNIPVEKLNALANHLIETNKITLSMVNSTHVKISDRFIDTADPEESNSSVIQDINKWKNAESANNDVEASKQESFSEESFHLQIVNSPIGKITPRLTENEEKFFYIDVIRWLFNRPEVDKNARNNDGMTGFLIAWQKWDGDIFNNVYLGKPMNIKLTKKTANIYLSLAACNGNVDLMRVCLQNGANVNARNDNADTPLHLASTLAKYNKDVLKILILAGADISAKNSQGWNALHYASRLGKLSAVKYLHGIKKDLVKEITNDGSTALHLAINCSGISNADVRKMQTWLVVKGKINLQATDNDGLTALQRAVARRDFKTVRNLLKLAKLNI